MKNRMKKQSGFTLLEVMVVVVILGILASFVVPNLLGNKEKSGSTKGDYRYCCARECVGYVSLR